MTLLNPDPAPVDVPCHLKLLIGGFFERGCEPSPKGRTDAGTILLWLLSSALELLPDPELCLQNLAKALILMLFR